MDDIEIDRFLFFMSIDKMGGVFKSLFEIMNTVNKTVILLVNERGIKSNLVDPHNHMRVSLFIDGAKCKQYFCNDELEIGLDTRALSNINKQRRKNDNIKMYIMKDNPNEFFIVVEKDGYMNTSHARIQKCKYCELVDCPCCPRTEISYDSGQFLRLCRSLTGKNSVDVKYNSNTIAFCLSEYEGASVKESVRSKHPTTRILDESDYEYRQQYKGTYFSCLTKLSGVSPSPASIQVRALSDDTLEFKANVGNLGEIIINLKSIEKIEKESQYGEIINNEPDFVFY